jgi:hypothetical protein
MIRRNPSLADDSRKLWKRVISGSRKVANNQMDVVVALWSAGLILHRGAYRRRL